MGELEDVWLINVGTAVVARAIVDETALDGIRLLVSDSEANWAWTGGIVWTCVNELVSSG